MSNARERYYHQFYNKESSYWASVYRSGEEQLSVYATHFRQRREVILDMVRRLGLPAGARVLDAGCGPGAYIRPFLEMGFRVAATDQSEKMIEEASRNFDPRDKDRVTLEVGALDALPFESKSFDLVINVAVLMYVENDAKAIAELHRVLKPGGTLIATVDNRRDLADRLDLPMRLIRLWRRVAGQRPKAAPASSGQPVKARTYSPDELKEQLRKAGFVTEEDTSLGFTPLLFKGRRFLPDRVDLYLDRRLQLLRRVPGLRLGGYTYICRARRAH